MNVEGTRQSVFKFRAAYQERYGTCSPSVPSDVGQVLGLAITRNLVMSLLLEVDPKALEMLLDNLVWQADLKEESLVAARNELGLPNQVISPINTRIKPTRKVPAHSLKRTGESGFEHSHRLDPAPPHPPLKTRGEWMDFLISSSGEQEKHLLDLDVTLRSSMSDGIVAERHPETFIAAAALQEREACAGLVLERAEQAEREGEELLGLRLRTLALRIRNGHYSV